MNTDKKTNIYLDYASTTPVDPKVIKAMGIYWNKYYGNPSGLYQLALQSKKDIDAARGKIAKILNCQADEIIFTGSGTESVNLAIKGVMNNVQKGHLIVSAIEHQAVLNSAKALKKSGHSISILPVDSDGLINIENIKKEIKNNTRLISIMIANNEIGVIQDIARIGILIEKINKERVNKKLAPIYFHTDACQAAGTLDLNVQKLHIDLLTINASKIYGPKGIGVLFIKKGTDIGAIIDGGGQEKNLRSGTENVPFIIGLATALELVDKNKEKENIRLSRLRDKLIKKLLSIDRVILNGHHSKRLANNINVSILGVEGESVLLYLDKVGIQASTGSACSSASLEPSHVITALGNKSDSSIRFTLGKYTKEKDIDYLVKNLITIIKQLRK